MNIKEVKTILAEYLSRYRAKSYLNLAMMAKDYKVETWEVKGKKGELYQLEFECIWDSDPDGDIRVMGTLNDAGTSMSIRSITDGFIVSPEGKYFG